MDTLIHRIVIYPLDSVIRPLLVQLGPGPFLLLAADNTNVNEETLDGKNNSCDIHACISETAEYIAAEVLAEADEYSTVVPKTKHLAPITRKLDNAIHWIKLYTVDTLIHRIVIYPLDSVIRPLLVQLGPGPFLLLAADNTNVNEETLDGKNNSCDIHACISETAEYINQNHPRSNWPTTMTRNYPYRQGEARDLRAKRVLCI